MQQRNFGGTGRTVARIGQGSWNIEVGNRKAAIAALRLGLERGMTHIDTAEMYGSGEAERIIAEALDGAARRDSCFLVSKVLPQNASRAGTIRACEASLKRLKTDRLDCYLLHWRGQHPLNETVAAFETLQRDGKILSWGVSNFDEADLAELLQIAGAGRVACNQVLYHLQERAIEHAVIPFCERQGIAVVAYSPFGSDSFPSAQSKGGKLLAEIAQNHQAGTHGVTARQVALSFLTRRASVFAIPKAAKVEHAADNAVAGDLNLSEAEIAQIDAAFPLGRKPRSLPMI